MQIGMRMLNQQERLAAGLPVSILKKYNNKFWYFKPGDGSPIKE